MNDQLKISISALLGALGVIAGAFGAHGLRDLLEARQLASWKTAVFYLFLHVIVMLMISVIETNEQNQKTMNRSWWLFIIGIFFFSGSIFLLSLKSVLPFSVSWLGPVTPIGGILFILGWLNLAKVKKA